MFNAPKGKTLTTMTVILPKEEVAAELMDVANGHFEFMQEKSYRDCPLKLIQYYISSGPEWKERASFLDGKTPEKTGRVVMTLVEIYEAEDGLHHHWIESKESHQILEDLLKKLEEKFKSTVSRKSFRAFWTKPRLELGRLRVTCEN